MTREGNIHNMHKDLMGICKYNFEKFKTPLSSGLECQDEPMGGIEMKKSKLLRSPRDKKNASSKGAKILKRSSSASGSKQNTLTSPFLSEDNPFSPHGTPQPTLSTPSPFGLGNMAQEQSHTHSRRGDRPDHSSTYGHSGMGKGESLCGV